MNGHLMPVVVWVLGDESLWKRVERLFSGRHVELRRKIGTVKELDEEFRRGGKVMTFVVCDLSFKGRDALKVRGNRVRAAAHLAKYALATLLVAGGTDRDHDSLKAQSITALYGQARIERFPSGFDAMLELLRREAAAAEAEFS